MRTCVGGLDTVHGLWARRGGHELRLKGWVYNAADGRGGGGCGGYVGRGGRGC